ncbi:MAG: GNAT family N-acetyltransferase [Thalassobius sp.]|nr:GNAT family N-acetyltransferase [Thalassovita sp.]
MKYFITSERLGFSKWENGYFLLAKRLWGDIEVTKLIDARGVLDDSQIKEKLEIEISNEQKFGVQYYPIFLLEGNDFVGCCGLRPYDLEREIYEIGFHLIPKYWRRGLAFEAAKRIITFAFDEKQADKIFAGHNPKNTASKKLLTKLQFSYIGDEFFKPTGLYHPSYILEKNKGD